MSYSNEVQQTSFHLLLPCLEPEYDNLRVDLQWFMGQGKMSAALRLGDALEWFWAGGSSWSEGRWWLEQILAQGKTDRQIAEQLVISPRTVNTHVTSLYRKIDVISRSAATRYALEHGLFSAL